MYKNRYFWVCIFLLLSVFSLTIGVEDFNLLGALSGSKEDLHLLLVSRLPRLISIIVTASILSINGLVMQTMSNNKFVSPSTTGIMDWCKLGVLVVLLFFQQAPIFLKILVALVFGLIGSFLFMKLIKIIGTKDNLLLPLIGIMLGGIVGSISTFFAYKFEILQNISAWLQGNFSLISKGNYEILYFGIPFLIVVYLYANLFTISGLGENITVGLGLDHNKILSLGMMLISATTAIVVVTIGSIPFIGLIIPNIISIIKGDNLKSTIFDTALLGSYFLLICDLMGRLIYMPYEIPISVIVGVLGSVVFLLILFKGKKYAR
ncbi:iron chelate uptake ABC transporter family permease subunit [Gemella palaticanis]|uniref:Iron chelate uptake ABC transporter family permease subunit n=1 Tax=Gemelliphila palaticanis TaxID=81950 RepID=A0ABX2SYW4_9BACL|nr:iron chelate uptake ABC transporter family permease subunit [Gemella palaticanis]NYS47445.1 iron chelate uptake ABC transporter family permease subunit [Gemella palaticanis]